jgi:hypothetical protein
MTLFLILAPYGIYAFMMLVTSATASLVTAGAVCLGTIALDKVRGRSLKILPTGTAIVFAGVIAWLHLIDPALSDKAVKVAVDGGILVISLGSLLLRYPFTLQYALERVHPEIAAMPGFLRSNYIITGVWSASMLLMLLANAAILYVPGLPIWLGLAVAFAARNSAVYFTRWYPARVRQKHGAAPPNALPHSH